MLPGLLSQLPPTCKVGSPDISNDTIAKIPWPYRLEQCGNMCSTRVPPLFLILQAVRLHYHMEALPEDADLEEAVEAACSSAAGQLGEWATRACACVHRPCRLQVHPVAPWALLSYAWFLIDGFGSTPSFFWHRSLCLMLD